MLRPAWCLAPSCLLGSCPQIARFLTLSLGGGYDESWERLLRLKGITPAWKIIKPCRRAQVCAWNHAQRKFAVRRDQHRYLELQKALDQTRQRAQLMEDETVAHQVIVFDGLSLLIPAILRDDALAAEEGPLEEPVERLALVGGILDGRTQLRVQI